MTAKPAVLLIGTVAIATLAYFAIGHNKDHNGKHDSSAVSSSNVQNSLNDVNGNSTTSKADNNNGSDVQHNGNATGGNQVQDVHGPTLNRADGPAVIPPAPDRSAGNPYMTTANNPK
ncbi:MAG: hypothetical protein HY064_01240 [Bacteroidetes bacterium]|nr:hypothetical protein [Bacteroidota bacterium]